MDIVTVIVVGSVLGFIISLVSINKVCGCEPFRLFVKNK